MKIRWEQISRIIILLLSMHLYVHSTYFVANWGRTSSFLCRYINQYSSDPRHGMSCIVSIPLGFSNLSNIESTVFSTEMNYCYLHGSNLYVLYFFTLIQTTTISINSYSYFNLILCSIGKSTSMFLFMSIIPCLFAWLLVPGFQLPKYFLIFDFRESLVVSNPVSLC